MTTVRHCLALLSLAVVVTHESVASADTVVVTGGGSTEGSSRGSAWDRGGPNPAMLSSGLVTFGLMYGAAVIVASESSLDSDHHMYVPIAGPWMALSGRGGCGDGSGRTCDAQTTNEVLIIADGIGQALGVIMIVKAFINPDDRGGGRMATLDAKPTLHLTPASMGAGAYGMVAFGTF